MKKCTVILLPLVLTLLTLRGLAESTPPEPGPESGALRLRLSVTPKPDGGNEGYDVQVDLISVSRESIVLKANWRSGFHEGGFKEYLEAATSIESYPAIEPWLGQVQVGRDKERQPEYAIKPGETLSLKWHTKGRHLKNKVSDPLEVQNPEFTENGLHSVHARLVIATAGRSVQLRSNEQLVPIGGSRELPKHTYGPLWDANEETKTATLGLGSRHKIMPGDRFRIQSGTIGMTWTLTITKVEADRSFGNLEPSQVNPMPAFPLRGANAALIPKK